MSKENISFMAVSIGGKNVILCRETRCKFYRPTILHRSAEPQIEGK